ncbi:r3h domain-containing protein [Ophiostoma piceae UAMH 11346]|uniref:R3h domain-containing protein n=1 Tax=Ophiostoma piceae (strain UAMH 11346) TaxID=1262450 RepID=S3CAW7_OPHP1|nr:r3h domain-containing protein [Ophiostoma piceae UAMH 11346]
MTTETGKMSFAKVAASASKKDAPAPETAPGVSPSIVDGPKSRQENLPQSSSNGIPKATALPSANAAKPALIAVTPSQYNAVDKATSAVINGVQSLHITSSFPPSLSRKPSDSNSLPTAPTSDEASQKADSNSELGTKPPSLDGKSITSGTTFNALDEKESLRPDDSASVKAATDEDDAFSIRGSLLISSRFGSDVAPRGQRMIQIGDMPPRILPAVSQETAVSSNVTPSSSSEQQPVTEARVQLATSTAAPPGVNGQYPDEKLLEAMQSQKDRLFLLRLENDVVNFVQNSKEPFMDLPPSNSFCRMLTHKLADYYHMTHSFEAVAGSVRIYRTPFCRVPPPLGSFVPASTPSSVTPPPPVIQPKKIMRRGEEFEILSSSGPSKATSEVDSDYKDKVPLAKEKMSREEREEAYNKARERIFGTATEVSTPENDDGTGISRASSVSAKDKTAASKKNKASKQRRDDSESFDSRSQYTLLYNHSQQTTWVPPQFYNGAPMPMQAQPHPGQTQQLPVMAPQQPPHYANTTMQPVVAYGLAGPGYAQAIPANDAPPAAGGIMHYPPQPMPPRHVPQGSQPAYPFPPQPPQGAGPPQWQQQPLPPQPQPQPQVPPFNAGTYPLTQTRPAPTGPPGPAQANMMYAFGQLPANFNPNDPKSQHPIPGSYIGNYSRHGFNPKTQSFVPGTGPISAPGMPGPQGPYSGHMGLATGPMVIGPPAGQPQNGGSYNAGGYQQPGLSTSPYGGSTTSSGYGMMRQGSGSSTSAYPHAAVRPGPAAFHDPYGNAAAALGQPHGPQGVPLPHGPHSHPPFAPHGPANSVANGAHLTPPRGPSHYINKVAGSHPPQGPKKQQQQNVPQGPKGASQAYNGLPHYGNPATLPQKPTAT